MDLNGTVATCSCEDFEYSVFTGQQFNRPDDGTRYYDILEYRAAVSGNVVVISNWIFQSLLPVLKNKFTNPFLKNL